MAITIEPLSQSNSDLWLKFFDERALKDNPDWDGCYCQSYLNSEEDDKAFPTSGLTEAEFLRARACDRLTRNATPGYVAIDNEAVVGWMAAGPGELYKRFPKPDLGVARIICFTIDPLRRGEGIAHALIEFGLADLKSRGFTKVESKGVPEGLAASANYSGPISMYEKYGFSTVETFDDGYALMELIF